MKIVRYTNENILENDMKKMYNILINNLFINYPDFLEEKNKYDNQNNYEKWSNSIKNDSNYEFILLYNDNELIGFLNYTLVNGDRWISEIQIKDKHKKTGKLKILISEFCNCIDEKEIFIHINSNNKNSKNIFTHIGFEICENSIYSICLKELKKWAL